LAVHVYCVFTFNVIMRRCECCRQYCVPGKVHHIRLLQYCWKILLEQPRDWWMIDVLCTNSTISFFARFIGIVSSSVLFHIWLNRAA